MPAWKAIEQAEPEFAGRVRRLFDVGRHKTIATLRADGSPRVSGIECEFTDGDLRFGSMTGALKGADLKRDPRFALHGPAFHPEEGKERDWPGEDAGSRRTRRAGRTLPDAALVSARTEARARLRACPATAPRHHNAFGGDADHYQPPCQGACRYHMCEAVDMAVPGGLDD